MARMIPNMLRSLVRGPATRRYPDQVREPFAGSRGELVNRIEGCVFCGVCARRCPSQCLRVTRDKEAGLGAWEYDQSACVFCGQCVEHCPTGCLEQLGTWAPASEHKSRVLLRAGLKVRDRAENRGGEGEQGPAEADETGFRG
ncbi:MAG: 4Fe-4S binding protein [Desulfovibrionaceae bacterium]|nr:4Fe-4S binding protein [Desulfovibrionaceae bacterium]